MKIGIIVLIVAGLIALTGLGYSFVVNINGGGQAAISADKDNSKVINVDELAAKPDDYQGNIIVYGVVAGINKAEGVFGVIDAREFKSCGVLSCARYNLPVKYSQNAPGLKSFVNITGRLRKDANGMLIIASKVEVLK